MYEISSQGAGLEGPVTLFVCTGEGENKMDLAVQIVAMLAWCALQNQTPH